MPRQSRKSSNTGIYHVMRRSENRSLIYIIVLVLLSIFSCSEKENYHGDDIRLWKDTEAWEFAKSISKNDFEKAEEILAKGKIDVDYREPKYGQTLLFWAVWNADFDAVKFLINHGAGPNTHNTYNGNSPIAIASDYFIRSDILVYLLSHGGNPNDYVKKDEKLSYAPVNETPLIRAAFTSLEKTKILVKAGADVNFFVDNDFRNTPLLSAERRTNLDIVEYLFLECKADYKKSYVITIDTGDTLSFKDIIQKRKLVTAKDSIVAKRIIEIIDEQSQ